MSNNGKASKATKAQQLELRQTRTELNNANRELKEARRALQAKRAGLAVGTADGRADRTQALSRLSPRSFADYLEVLIDPENATVDPDLQIPGFIQFPTIAWKNKWRITVEVLQVGVAPNTKNIACALFKPGLMSCFAATNHLISNAAQNAFQYLESTTGGNSFATWPFDGDDTMLEITPGGIPSGILGVNGWDCCPDSGSIRKSFVAVQPIAASLTMRTTGAPLGAQGSFLSASIPGSQNIAYSNSTQDSMTGVINQVLDYDSLATLLDARTGPVLDGARVIYIPEGMSAARLRPTKAEPPFAAGITGSQILGKESLPTCDGDPSEFLSVAASLNSPANVSNFFYDPTGAGRTAGAQQSLTNTFMYTLGAVRGMDSPVLCCYADNMEAGTSVEFVFTQVMCGIADSQSWSLTRSPLGGPGVSSRQEKAAALTMRLIPKNIPRHPNVIGKVKNIATRTYEFLSKNWDKVENYGPAILNASSKGLRALGLGEAAGLIDAVASSASVAELVASLAL